MFKRFFKSLAWKLFKGKDIQNFIAKNGLQILEAAPNTVHAHKESSSNIWEHDLGKVLWSNPQFFKKCNFLRLLFS